MTLEVVRNTLSDLPMHYAFKGKDTNLFKGLEKAAEIAAPWQPKSTVLFVISDGDTVPATGMPKMPVSIYDMLVIGVGDPVTGKFIAGKNSRQDVSTLRQVAARLGGEFHNGNTQHISSGVLAKITQDVGKKPWEDLGRRRICFTGNRRRSDINQPVTIGTLLCRNVLATRPTCFTVTLSTIVQ